MRLLTLTPRPAPAMLRHACRVWPALALLACAVSGAGWWLQAPLMLAALRALVCAPPSRPHPPWFDLSVGGMLLVGVRLPGASVGRAGPGSAGSAGRLQLARLPAAVCVGPWGCVVYPGRGQGPAVVVQALPQRSQRALQRQLLHGRASHGGVQGSGRFPVSL